MFNARPTSLLGLEPRQGAGQHEWVNHLTPMLTSPDDLFKYYERFNEFINATTPTSLSAIELSGQFQSQLQQSAQQYMPDHNHIPNCPQHLQQPAQQQQVPPQQHQPPPPPPPSTQPQPQQQPQLQPQLQQPQLQPQLQQLQQQQQQQPQLPVQPQYPQQQLDEEKLRNKRERNRKAAANCRRRKDEKLKKLEEENSELRKIIETLKASISALRMGCETEMES